MLQITFKSRTLVNNAFGENILKNPYVQNTYKSLMCLIENKQSLRYRYAGFKGDFFFKDYFWLFLLYEVYRKEVFLVKKEFFFF